MRNRLFLLISTLICIISTSNLSAQNNFIISTSGLNPSSINTCQGLDTFRFRMLNQTAGILEGVLISYTLPAGVTYVSSFTNSPGTLSQVNVTNLNNPILGFSNMASGDNPLIEIVTQSSCGVVGQVTLTNGITLTTTSNSDVDSGVSPTYVPNNPSIITSADINTVNAQFGQTYSRIYTLEESGNGFLTEVLFERTFGDAYTVDSLLLVTGSGDVNIPFTVIPGSGSVDTIRLTFSNADLIAAGITDGTFDQGDQFQIREVITVIDCSGNNAGQAVGFWGCGGTVCEKVNPISVGILFGSFQPNLNIIDRSPEDLLGFLPAGAEHPVAYGCGASYRKAVMLENVGNETANNIRVDLYQIDPQLNILDTAAGFFYQVGLGGALTPVDSFVLTEAWNSPTEVSNIAFGGPVPRRVFLYISEPILAGDSLIIVHSQINIPNDQSTGLYGCTTGGIGFVIDRARIQGLVYTDACGTGNIVEGSQGDENYNYNRLAVGQGTSPTIVFGGGAPGTTEFISSSAILDGFQSIGNSLGALDSSAYIDFRFNLPTGLDYAGDPLNPADGNFELISSNGVDLWIPDTLLVTDSTFIARYRLAINPMPAGFGWTTNTTVNFSYVADCSEIIQPPCPAPQINPNVTIEKEFYVVMDTACPSKFYLDCIQVTDPIQVYCNACPCALGVQYSDADVMRSSLGNPDNDRNGIVDTMANGDIQPVDSLDFTEIRLLNFIEGDTLSAYYEGFVNTTLGAGPGADTVTVMPYMYGYVTTPNASQFVGLTGSATIFDASTGVQHVSTVPLPTFNEGNSIFVDLSGDVLTATAGMTPPLPAAFVYEDEDSVRFDLDMRVTRDIGNVELTTDFELVIFGSDSIYPSNIPSNRRFVCIPPGVNQRRLKQFGWSEDKTGQTTVLVAGCQPNILFNFAHNILWSTGWTNPFPYEHRRLFNIPEMTFNLPDGFIIADDSIEIYSYRNNPLGTNILTIFDAPYEIIAGGDSVRVFNIEILNEIGPAGDIRSNGPLQINVRPVFQATCEVPDGSLNTIRTAPSVGYNQEQFVGLRDSVFVSTRETTGAYSIDYSAPQLNAIAASPIVNAVQKVATWEVNFSNGGASGNNAFNTWFYFDNAPSAGQINIDSVRDISTDSVYLISAGGFFQLGNLNGASTRQFEVYASFTNCNLECVDWYYGYNCPSYIPTTTDPLLSLPSCAQSRSLCIQPNEALWQAAVITGLDSTDLCVTNTLEYEFTNVQTGHSYNTAVRIDMPLNSFVDLSSVFIEYPASGTSVPVPASAIQFNAPSEYIVYIDSVFDSLSVQGLPGPLTSGQNNFRISYDVEFSCDYISGSGINTSVFGENACGSATNEAGAPNQIVYIFGVPEPYFINPRVSANDSLNACSTDLTVRINMLKFGTNGIGANDSMRLTLPLGVSYVPGSIVFLNNPLPQTEPTLDTIGNVVLNTWLLPTGVAELDSIDFTIDLAIGDNVDCGTPGILVQTFVDNTAFCVTLGTNCGVKAQTGSRAFNLNVVRPTITVDNSGAAVLLAGATNVYQLDAQFENMDLVNDIPAGLTYDVYCADAAGLPTGPIIYTGTTSAIAAGDSAVISESFNSTTLCSVADGLALVFQRSPANCLCDGSFLVPLSLLESIVAVDDADTTQPSAPIVINVLANDSSFTSSFDTTSLAEVDAPMNGTLVIDNTTGEITYTPNDGFSGTDMFTYVVCAQEIAVNCDTATVTIYVPNTTTSKDDINSTLIDTPVSGSVVTNDGDPQGDSQLVNPVPVAMPMNGMVTLLPNGNYTYTPNPGFSGQDEFQYEICDNGTPVACDTATVYITIEPRPIAGNNPPIAEQDIATTEVGVPVTLSLLSNDSEIDGDSIIINTTPLTGPSSGTVTINTDGTADYIPNPGFVGVDTFTYTICDPFGLCDTTEAIITIIPDIGNEVFANDDAGAGLQDMPISGSMIANDSDPEGDVFFINSLTPVSNVSNGTVILNNDGTYVYTPNPGYTGPDQFSYQLCDNGTPQACDIATVYLTVLPAPNSTTASNDINSTPQDIAVAGNVLTNDRDDEGDNQLVNPTPLSTTTNGTVSLFPNGSYVYTPAPGFTGNDQFTYEVCDDASPQACDTATVFITVVGNPGTGNNPPVANQDEGTTEVNTPVDGDLLSNDSDPDGDVLTVNTTPLSGPSNGGVTINPDGTYTYVPNPGFIGVDTFEYNVCDPFGLCDTTIAIITILPDNGNTTFTQDDAGTGLQDQPIIGNISSNDSDPEGNVQSVNTTPLSGPSNGSVTILPNGDYTYNPTPGFVGNDQFVYNVCDNGSPIACDTATVYLTVLPPFTQPIVAVNDSATAVTGVPVNINVIANDTADAGFNNPTLAEVTPPNNGMVTYNNDGTVDYTSTPGFIGIDTFDYVICDLLLNCDTVTVFVTVTPGPNNPPNAMNDDTTTLEDTPVVIDPLTNDVDLDGPLDSTSVTIVTPPMNGTATVDPVTGEITVTPDPNFTGVITLQYEVCDTATPPLCDIATVTVTIIPTPDTVVVSVPEDSVINLCTDTTVNFNNPISGISICGAPSNGTITPSFIPCLDYMPNMDYVGPDTLCVVTCAGSVCDTTIFVIDVTPVNDPPVALDDDTTTLEDSPVVIDPLTNDTDLEGPLDSTSVTEVTPPMNGSITIDPATGEITYTPDPNFVGVDEFTYSVCDTGSPVLCDEATVTVTITSAPDTIMVTVPEDGTETVCTGSSVNFADPITSVSLCDAPDNGTTAPGILPCIEYTPNMNYVGPDTMCIVTCSGVYCDTTIVLIMVTPVNDPPVALDDDTTTLEDTPVLIDPLTNDTDLDGPLDSTSVTEVTPPMNGSITIDPITGEITYTPDPNFVGVDEFTYSVCDTGLPVLCAEATVTVTITSSPDTIMVTVPEDGTETVCTGSSVNFTDPITSVSLCDAPDNGTTAPGILPCIEYSPSAGYVGPDTMCIVTCSGVFCDTTIVLIDVTPVNDPPVAVDDFDNTPEDTPITINVIANDSDDEGPLDSTSVTIVTGPTNGTVVVNGDGTVTYTPDSSFVGIDMFTYSVCDTGLPVLCDEAVVTIAVPGVPDTSTVVTPEDTPLTLCTDSLTNFVGPIDLIQICGAPMNGTVNPTFLPCVVYTPNADYVGPDTMCVVSCSNGICDTTLFFIEVTPVNDPPVAIDDNATTTEDTPVNIDLVNNDTDIDGPIDSASITITTPPMNGTVTVNPDGTVDYTPNPNFCGVDMFNYSVCDTGLPVLCDEALVTVNITCAPDTILVTVPEDEMETICTGSSVNFADPITSVSLCDAPDNGTTAPGILPCIEYTPNMNYVGPDTMCIVTCAGAFCDTTIVIIDVTPVNDPPVALDDNATTTEDTPVNIDLVNNDTDLDGPIDSTSITITTPPMNGTVTVNPDGTVDYTPDPNFCGVDMFNYSVCDTGLPVLCDEALVTVNVACAPDTTLLTLPEDSMITLCTDSLTNLAGPIDNISLCGAPSDGAITQEFLPCVTYTPNPDYFGQDTTCLITCAGSVCDTTYVIITVTPIIDVPVLDPIANICETSPIPALTGTSEPGSVIQWIENGVVIGTGSPFTPPAIPGLNCYQAVAFNGTLGLTSPDTAQVCFNIDSLPTNVNAGPDDTICGFQDYELQATGNGRLVFWTQIVGQQVSLDLSNPNAIAALEPNNTPGTDNIYTFAWTNRNGLCTVSDTVTIWVTNPHFTDAGNDTTVCIPEAGGSVQLNATLTPGATGWWNYVGTGNISFVDSTDAQTVVNGLIPYVNPTSTYLFEWYEQIDSCIARDEVVITVNEAPGLTVVPADTFCLGSDYTLSAAITGFSQASYSWRLNGPTGQILSWDENAVVSPLVNTTYYVVASVAFGQNFCTNIDSLELFVDGLPVAVDDGCFDLFEDSLLIGSTNDWLLNDDLTAVITGSVGFEVLNGGSVLDPASTLVIDNATDTYVYTPFPDMSGVDSATIIIFNEACPDLRDTFVVCFNVIPVTDDPIVAMPDTFNIIAGSTVAFPILDNDTLNGQAVETVVTILLDPIYGSIDTPIMDGIVIYNSETEFASVDSFQYIVCQYLVDGEELCDTTTVIILVDGELYIPEGFTPNGDGTNDFFEIPNIGLLYPNATLQIYNRWGDEVWNSRGSYMNNWDGTNFNGSQLPDGTYFYIVKLNNGSGRSMASYVVIYR